jgi:NAD-dependent dihydropyrimidine dehydrogenase PreA subunit
MKRDILKIDEELCNGCGQCVPNCHEGALQVIDGKVRLVSELMCDGLGACIGHCPEGAITIETREAEPYNEIRVMEQMKDKGKNTVIAHLKHMKDHGETGFLQEGVSYLKEHKAELNFNLEEVLSTVHNHGNQTATAQVSQNHLHTHGNNGGGCPGSKAMVIEKPVVAFSGAQTVDQPSELRQWPVQMHLINPNASYFQGSDLLVAADCVAFSMGGFHSKHLKGKSLAIACPKLDHGMDIYVQKMTALIDSAKVNTITVMMMEVPCCGGLLQMVKSALSQAARKVPVKMMIVGIAGEVLKEEWV